MKLLFAGLLFTVGMQAQPPVDPAKPFPPIILSPADATRLKEMGHEQELAVARRDAAQAMFEAAKNKLEAIDQEAAAIRYKTCAVASVVPDKCGPFVQGGVQRLPDPEKPKTPGVPSGNQ